MILIIGGAWQGKLTFAKETFALSEEEICICKEGYIDFSKRCIYGVEEFAWNHPDPEGFFRENREKWENSILIIRDVFCGVVPMDAQTRDWRQKVGRLSQYLSREAQQVSRIFCGLEQRLK